MGPELIIVIAVASALAATLLIGLGFLCRWLWKRHQAAEKIAKEVVDNTAQTKQMEADFIDAIYNQDEPRVAALLSARPDLNINPSAEMIRKALASHPDFQNAPKKLWDFVSSIAGSLLSLAIYKSAKIAARLLAHKAPVTIDKNVPFEADTNLGPLAQYFNQPYDANNQDQKALGETLLQNEALDVNENIGPASPLLLAIKNHYPLEVIDALIQKGVAVNNFYVAGHPFPNGITFPVPDQKNPYAYGRSPLMQAVWESEKDPQYAYQVAQRLLQVPGIFVNSVDHYVSNEHGAYISPISLAYYFLAKENERQMAGASVRETTNYAEKLVALLHKNGAMFDQFFGLPLYPSVSSQIYPKLYAPPHPLLRAFEDRDLEEFKKLLNQGYDPNFFTDKERNVTFLYHIIQCAPHSRIINNERAFHFADTLLSFSKKRIDFGFFSSEAPLYDENGNSLKFHHEYLDPISTPPSVNAFQLAMFYAKAKPAALLFEKDLPEDQSVSIKNRMVRILERMERYVQENNIDCVQTLPVLCGTYEQYCVWRDEQNKKMMNTSILSRDEESVLKKLIDARSSPWKVLGISESASATEINKAYGRKAKLSHPDKNLDSAAQNDFHELTSLKVMLLDPSKNPYVKALFSNQNKTGDAAQVNEGATSSANPSSLKRAEPGKR